MEQIIAHAEIKFCDTRTGCGYDPLRRRVYLNIPIARWSVARQTIRYCLFGRRVRDNSGNYYLFNANNYWSATENNATNSWYVNFNNGNTNNNNKTNTNYVRCVR